MSQTIISDNTTIKIASFVHSQTYVGSANYTVLTTSATEYLEIFAFQASGVGGGTMFLTYQDGITKRFIGVPTSSPTFINFTAPGGGSTSGLLTSPRVEDRFLVPPSCSITAETTNPALAFTIKLFGTRFINSP